MLTHNTRLAENKDFYLPEIKKYIIICLVNFCYYYYYYNLIIIIIIILRHRELSQMLSIKFLLLLLKKILLLLLLLLLLLFILFLGEDMIEGPPTPTPWVTPGIDGIVSV